MKLPLTYHQPDHCGHWAITDADGVELACPGTPPAPELLELIFTATATNTPVQPPLRAQNPSPLTVPKNRRPAPSRPWFPNGPTWNWMGRNDVTIETVRAILENPDFIEHPSNHRIAATGRGYQVIADPSNRTVLAVKPIVPLRNGGHERRRTHGKTDTRLPTPATVREFIELLKRRGYDVDHRPGSGHYRVTHPQHPSKALPLPATPSDYRWADNQIRDHRTVFGVDLRNPQP